MPVIYLTPAAIGYLTEFILVTLIALYLASRLRHTLLRTQTAWLVCFFAATALLIFLLLGDVALPPSQRVYAVFLENIAVGLCLVFLLQFAYNFPSLDPHKKWEALVVLGLSILYTLWETQFALFRYTELSAGHVYYRQPYADYPLIVGFLWVPIVFIRQAIFADDRRVMWIRKLLRPHGREAQTARTFALVYLLTLVLALVNLLRSASIIPTSIYQLGLSVGLMFALFTSAIVYLNSVPEMTSFIVKLSGTTLTVLLMVLSSVGWVMSPAYTAAYRPPISDQQTLRFTPNALGGYDVTHVPFHFDDNLGQVVDMPTTGNVDEAALDFTFRFFGKTRQTIYVQDVGTVSIGQSFEDHDVQYRYGTVPAIFLLNTHLLPEAGGGIFAKNTGERLTITWSKAPFFFDRQVALTLQLVLEQNGNFEITYHDLPKKLTHDLDQNPFENIWLIGAVPGDFTQPPRQVALGDLPWQSGTNGLVQDYYLDFRQYLHRLLEPLAYLILLSSLLIVSGVPLLLYFSIVAPLNRLMTAVRQVNDGTREITMPIQSRDEIGYLTDSFNRMIAQLSAHVTELEARVAERTAALHQLAITDPVTNIFNRRHLMILGNQALVQAQRYRHPLSALMIDIDHFKRVNDEHGHAVGDEALKKLADYMQTNLRAVDILGRYGGEEFVILMPETNLETARQTAERLLIGIRALRFDAKNNQVGFTTSIGVAALDHADDPTIDTLIASADRAMYAAKEAGRDRVVAHTE